MEPKLPTPTERLLAALDPQGDTDLGLAVVIAQDLPGHRTTVLAELIRKQTPAGDRRRL